MGFDPAPFWAAPMPSQKGRLLIASSQANPQVAEEYVLQMAHINSGQGLSQCRPWQRAMLH